MKKILLLFLLCIGLSIAGYSQAAGKGSGEKSGGSKVKPRGQMRHFERRKKDPKMKHNGTSYKKKRRRGEKAVDGDGFSNSPGKGKRRRKK